LLSDRESPLQLNCRHREVLGAASLGSFGGGHHTFFFIQMYWWGPILAVIALIVLLNDLLT
jgi:hypothetical protein